MWDWIIPFLLKMLVEFLTELFSKWGPTDPTVAEDKFVGTIYWYFWFGPKRVEYARDLYRKAVQRYNEKKYVLVDEPWDRFGALNLAKQLCGGLKP